MIPALYAENVHKYFGGVQAVKGVSLSVEQGKVIGLIGPNGSGKSTLLNVMAGVYKPTMGSVRRGEKRIDGLSANEIVKRGVAKTNQIPRPFLTMSTRENVAVAVLYGVKGADDLDTALRRADEVLELVKLTGSKDALASNLTVQGKKRLEFARVIATGADMLLLDEIFAGQSADELRDSIKLFEDIRKQLSFSALVVEHVMKAVLSIAESVTVIEEGEKIAEGSPHEVVHNSRVIEAYLGAEKIGT